MLFLWSAMALYLAVLLAAGVFALKRGGPDEQLATVMFLAGACGSQVASFIGQRWLRGPEYGVMVCDVGLALGLLVVVRRSRKFWPLWAAAAALVGAVTHLVRFVNPTLSSRIYASIQPFWAFPILLAIVIGTVAHSERQ